MLIPNARGHYHFLQGIDPYSCGVVAESGFEIVRAALESPLPWRDGFDRIAEHLESLGHARQALCAVELRSPSPFTMQGFIEFNAEYCAILKQWDLYVDGCNPVARTNVCPTEDPPTVPSLHAFCYTRPNESIQRKTLVVAGAGELREGRLTAEGILRRGDTSPSALLEKATYVMRVMEERLRGLDGDWSLVSQVDVYSIYPLAKILEQVIWPVINQARRWGVHWYPVRPPVVDIDFEMDMRGLATEAII